MADIGGIDGIVGAEHEGTEAETAVAGADAIALAIAMDTANRSGESWRIGCTAWNSPVTARSGKTPSEGIAVRASQHVFTHWIIGSCFFQTSVLIVTVLFWTVEAFAPFITRIVRMLKGNEQIVVGPDSSYIYRTVPAAPPLVWTIWPKAL